VNWPFMWANQIAYPHTGSSAVLPSSFALASPTAVAMDETGGTPTVPVGPVPPVRVDPGIRQTPPNQWTNPPWDIWINPNTGQIEGEPGIRGPDPFAPPPPGMIPVDPYPNMGLTPGDPGFTRPVTRWTPPPEIVPPWAKGPTSPTTTDPAPFPGGGGGGWAGTTILNLSGLVAKNLLNIGCINNCSQDQQNLEDQLQVGIKSLSNTLSGLDGIDLSGLGKCPSGTELPQGCAQQLASAQADLQSQMQQVEVWLTTAQQLQKIAFSINCGAVCTYDTTNPANFGRQPPTQPHDLQDQAKQLMDYANSVVTAPQQWRGWIDAFKKRCACQLPCPPSQQVTVAIPGTDGTLTLRTMCRTASGVGTHG
jgi:hypothetical protein